MAHTLAGTSVVSGEGARTYSVLKPIGGGGNSTAFFALGSSGEFDGVPVAIKVFDGREKRRAAFLREIQHLRNHAHPTVLEIFDTGTTVDGAPYYVSRIMPCTLAELIADAKTTRYTKAVISTQLLSAVAHLVRSGPLVHRDIKPENIFVNGETVVLGDFGMLVRSDDDSIDPGTPEFYRTPELVRHKRVGGTISVASDVFQSGLVIAQLFTGENPLPVAEGDRYAEVPAVQVPVGGEVDVAVATILNRMLELDGAKRSTALEALNLFKGVFQSEVAKQTVALT